MRPLLFIFLLLFLLVPVSAPAESWEFADQPLGVLPYKIAAAIAVTYTDPVLKKTITKKYMPSAVSFSADTDTGAAYLKIYNAAFSLEARLHGAGIAGATKATFSSSYDMNIPEADRFSFSGPDPSGNPLAMGAADVTAMMGEGSMTDLFTATGAPTGKSAINMNYRITGHLADGTPANISVTLAATKVPKL